MDDATLKRKITIEPTSCAGYPPDAASAYIGWMSDYCYFIYIAVLLLPAGQPSITRSSFISLHMQVLAIIISFLTYSKLILLHI